MQNISKNEFWITLHVIQWYTSKQYEQNHVTSFIFLSAIALRFDLFLPSSLQFQIVTHSTDAANNMGNISFFT